MVSVGIGEIFCAQLAGEKNCGTGAVQQLLKFIRRQWRAVRIGTGEGKIRTRANQLCGDAPAPEASEQLRKTFGGNPEQLKKFINEKGKILPRRATGACAKHQRDITQAVKRARHIAILPYTQN